MFYKSVGAMASNRSIVDSFAAQMGWSVERATATLHAYGTGMYLPPLEEVKALSTLEDFETEWRIALYAYHILELQRQGVNLDSVCKPETRAKWVRGGSVVSIKFRRKFLDVLGVDLDHVPEKRRYAHVGDGQGRKSTSTPGAIICALIVTAGACALFTKTPTWCRWTTASKSKNWKKNSGASIFSQCPRAIL